MKLLKQTFLLALSICMLSLGVIEAKLKQMETGTSETFPEVAKCFADPDYSAELAIEVAIHLAFAAQNDQDPNIKNYAKQSLHNWMKQVTHAKGPLVKHMDAWPKTHQKQFGVYLTKLSNQGHEGLVAAEQFAKEVKINWQAPADHMHRKKPESNKAKKAKKQQNQKMSDDKEEDNEEEGDDEKEESDEDDKDEEEEQGDDEKEESDEDDKDEEEEQGDDEDEEEEEESDEDS